MKRHTKLPSYDLFTWAELETYVKAYQEGRIPADIIEESQIIYELPGWFSTLQVPLPKHLDFKTALARATPKIPWWRRLRSRSKKTINDS